MEKNGDKQQTKVIKQSQLKPRQKQRRLEDPVGFSIFLAITFND